MAPVRFEVEGNLGVITIDNPPINLADNPLFAAFAEALDAVEAASIRALLVQAKGDHFGCGVNVNTTFVGLDGKTGRKMLNQGLAMVTRMEGLNIPIVCAVQGLCLAAALEIALRCDVIITSDESQVRPGGAAHWRSHFPRRRLSARGTLRSRSGPRDLLLRRLLRCGHVRALGHHQPRRPSRIASCGSPELGTASGRRTHACSRCD